MILAPGSRFGPYHVIDIIGAGAMGEVYRASDPKLGRDIALKILRADFHTETDRQASFEREARLLASLNHPNIGTIYGFHEADGLSALALELVDGETLAARLRRGGRLPTAEAFRYALQISDALACAHRRAVVHRDVKPSNIIVTSQGAKLVDFGLAHLVQPEAAAPGAGARRPTGDLAGAGTPFYMSPEQSAGLDIDQRSDIYSFGIVLCQMFTGFMPDAAPALSTRTLIRGLLQQIASRPLRLVIERCLASDPDDRWLHASDLHHALVVVAEPETGEAGSEDDDTTTGLPVRVRHGWPALVRRAALPAVILVMIALVVAFLAGRRAANVSTPAYQQLTFRRGSVLSARFAGDNSIVYSAAWDGRPTELWSMRPDNPESRSLGIPDARIVAISPSGDMAILIGGRIGAGAMLARLPLDASVPRQVLAGVDAADWAPDGQSLAVAHVLDGKSRLEFPIGTALFETEGWIDGVRVSPDGEQVAFIHHPLFYDDRGTISVIRRTGGEPRSLSGPWASVTGVAWARGGNEIWFTAAEFGSTTSLYAVDLSARVRVISRSANRMTIQDIDRNGRALVTEGRYRLRISAVDATRRDERDLSWLDGSVVTDLSPDGSTFLINEVASGAGTPLHAVYLRTIDGSPAVRIGDGASPALSPDGRWAAALLLRTPPSIVLLPIGAGMPRTLDRGPLTDVQMVEWFPDGRRILIAGNEAPGASRLWTQEVAGGPPTPVGPEGIRLVAFSRPISPDGTRVIATDLAGRSWIHVLTGAGNPHPIDGVEPGDLPIRWHGDGQSVYVFRQRDLPGIVDRVYLADGRKERVAVLAPADSAGVRTLASLQTTPEGRIFVYSYAQILSDLFLVTDVR